MARVHKELRITAHALAKIELLNRYEFLIDVDVVRVAMENPDRVVPGYGGRRIAHKAVSATHVLRVVFEESPEARVVVTLYPARRRRYEKR